MKIEAIDLIKLLDLTEYSLYLKHKKGISTIPVKEVCFDKRLGWLVRYQDCLYYDAGEESLKDLDLLVNYEQPGQIDVVDRLGKKSEFHLVLQRTEVVRPSYEELESFLA
jgi:hypothetical protein